MIRLFGEKTQKAFLLYIALDIIAAGMGMGVPIFCILLGIPVGWFISKKLPLPVTVDRAMKTFLARAAWTSGVTLIIMLLLWARTIPMMFDPASDFANFGIPMILYDPRLSFIGWTVLMILISPFLQLLVTVFAGQVTLLFRIRKEKSRP